LISDNHILKSGDQRPGISVRQSQTGLRIGKDSLYSVNLVLTSVT